MARTCKKLCVHGWLVRQHFHRGLQHRGQPKNKKVQFCNYKFRWKCDKIYFLKKSRYYKLYPETNHSLKCFFFGGEGKGSIYFYYWGGGGISYSY